MSAVCPARNNVVHSVVRNCCGKVHTITRCGWQNNGKKRSDLQRGAKLLKSVEMRSARQAELSAEEHAYIQHSEAEQRRQQWIWRGVFLALLTLLVLAGWQWSYTPLLKNPVIKPAGS